LTARPAALKRDYSTHETSCEKAMPPAAASPEMKLTLPDGSVRTFAKGTTGTEVAAAIGPGLAKAALAVKLDGKLEDLFAPIDKDATLAIVTAKDEKDALELIRHDCAHLMAQAVQDLFPGTQVTIGPVIEDGFFYDFARGEPFHESDLPRIEARMKEIVDEARPTRVEVWPRDKAIQHFKDLGEKYKAEIIADLPAGEPIKIYFHGGWHDLCRGPHLPSTKHIGKGFKLMKLAGAYWRGDHRNAMLQRIYGTAWRDEKELQAYLTRLEEAEKRDHRKIGKEMGLFHFQEEAVGQVFWHPHGWTLYRTLENYVRRKVTKAGYHEIKTPLLLDRKLWEASGHWENYREHMFIAEVDEGGPEKRMLCLKPMNCPAHVQIFKQGLRSYRELPLRLAEFGSCHRYEPSGALHGLMRVRGFVQDDAHIFCTEDQISDEAAAFVTLLFEVYRELGFDDPIVKFATRPEKRVGADEVWDRAERALSSACERLGIKPVLNAGDGAFYGPKLDFVVKDAIGREWQTGTFQCDPNLPERLGAEYVGEDGARHRPVMLHRAILGSLERFTGVLIEHYAGKFPLWLAPVQGVVATITSDADEYARDVLAALKGAGLRAELDLRNEKINYKVREHSLAKVPVMAVVGKKEAEGKSVSIRRLGSDKQESLSLSDFVRALSAEATPPDLRSSGF
jgi:threonyl-tRNA synthetase